MADEHGHLPQELADAAQHDPVGQTHHRLGHLGRQTEHAHNHRGVKQHRCKGRSRKVSERMQDPHGQCGRANAEEVDKHDAG